MYWLTGYQFSGILWFHFSEMERECPATEAKCSCEISLW